jgi:hypothetical protein
MKNKIEGSMQQKSKKQRAKNRFAKLSSLFATLCALVLPLLSGAQADTTRMPAPDMANTMRSNGKIYVVVAVLVIILLGLFIYLIRLDRKIGKLEKND